MNSLFPSNRGAPNTAPEGFSLVHLLKLGQECFREGSYVEGLAFFALARETLYPNEMDLAAILDAFTQSHKTYLHAQEDLLKASKHFAKVDAEQQMQLAALESLLLILERETNRVSHCADELLKNARDNEALQVPEPVFESFTDAHVSRQLPQITSKDNGGNESLSLPLLEQGVTLPNLYITCFGCFEVKRSGRSVILCSSRSGQSILRYLVTQPGHRATSDTLQAMLWPEEEPQVVQNKLHIAISSLRRSLNQGYTCESGFDYIVCKNRAYYLNPAAVIQTDKDEFLYCYRAGQRTERERVTYYERACHLYTGPFLPEDIYADWSFLHREQLSQIYLAMCRVLTDHHLTIKRYEDAAKWATAILKENRCDEFAHRQLIQVYAAQGYRSEAIHQYQRCERVLREELRVQPMIETQALFQAIITNEPTSIQ